MARFDDLAALIFVGSDECIVWPYGKGTHGYGAIYYKGEMRTTHSVAFEVTQGYRLPSDMDVRHLCHNRLCINPRHLAEGTRMDNVHDSVQDGRTNRILSDEDIENIRFLYSDGMKQRDIAAEFGLHQSTVNEIINRNKSYRNR